MQKGAKRLGAVMQQVCIEMKNGLSCLAPIARIVLETKQPCLNCKCSTQNYPVNQETSQPIPELLIRS